MRNPKTQKGLIRTYKIRYNGINSPEDQTPNQTLSNALIDNKLDQEPSPVNIDEKP